MTNYFSAVLFYAIILATTIGCSNKQQTKYQHNKPFKFTHEIKIKATPEAVFDSLTGNIKPWWDHTFSENPDSLFIEPFPGGGFYEYFDENKNGVRHAVVTASEKGKLLRLEGPLGLAGNSLLLVTTISLEKSGNDSTSVTVQVNGSGEVNKEWPELIKNVWKHFISDRLKPYIEGNLK